MECLRSRENHSAAKTFCQVYNWENFLPRHQAGVWCGAPRTARAGGGRLRRGLNASLLLRTLLIATGINLTDGSRCRYGALPGPVPRRRCVDVWLIFSTQQARRARCSRSSAARLGWTACVAPLCNPCRRGPLLLRAHRVLCTSSVLKTRSPAPPPAVAGGGTALDGWVGYFWPKGDRPFSSELWQKRTLRPLWTQTCCDRQTRAAPRSFSDDDHRFAGPCL